MCIFERRSDGNILFGREIGRSEGMLHVNTYKCERGLGILTYFLTLMILVELVCRNAGGHRICSVLYAVQAFRIVRIGYHLSKVLGCRRSEYLIELSKNRECRGC